MFARDKTSVRTMVEERALNWRRRSQKRSSESPNPPAIARPPRKWCRARRQFEVDRFGQPDLALAGERVTLGVEPPLADELTDALGVEGGRQMRVLLRQALHDEAHDQRHLPPLGAHARDDRSVDDVPIVVPERRQHRQIGGGEQLDGALVVHRTFAALPSAFLSRAGRRSNANSCALEAGEMPLAVTLSAGSAGDCHGEGRER